jgi:hypothetical protein
MSKNTKREPSNAVVKMIFRSNRPLAIFIGVPIAINVILFVLFSDNQGGFHGVSQRAIPYVMVGVGAGVVLVAMDVFYRLSQRLAVQLGVAAWITAFVVAGWYFWVGPGAFQPPKHDDRTDSVKPSFGWLGSKSSSRKAGAVNNGNDVSATPPPELRATAIAGDPELPENAVTNNGAK